MRPFALVGVTLGIRATQAIVLTVIFARGYGKSEFGEAAYALTLSSLLLPFFELGHRTILVREFSRRPEDSADWLSAAIQAKVVIGVLLCAAAYGGAVLLGDGGNVSLLVALASLTYVCRALEPYEMWSLARRDFESSAFAYGISFLVLIVSTGGCAFARAPLWVTMLVASLNSSIFSLSIAWLAHRRSSPPPFVLHVARGTFQRMLREAAPLVFSALAISLHMRLDLLLLMPYHGEVAVGLYAVAVRMSQGMYLIPMIIADATFPHLATATGKTSDDEARWARALRLQVGSALALTLVAFAAGPFLIEQLFGSAYSESGRVFRIHVLTLPFVAFGTLSTRYLIAHGQNRAVAVATAAGVTINLVLNFCLIPGYSIYGAAVSSSLSYLLGSSLVYAANREMRPLFVSQLQRMGVSRRSRAAKLEKQLIARSTDAT